MKLLFVGDVMLGRLVNRALKMMPAEYSWGNTLDVFRSADARFCNLRRFRHPVEQAREKKDLVVVSAHWGPNWGREVPKEHTALAHCLVDSGADVVFGHSAHVFRAVEIYRDRPILYSTGDFMDDYAVDPNERNDESFLFLVELGEEGETRVVLHPTTIREFQANLAEGERARSIAETMQNLCRSWNTASSWHPGEQRLTLSGTGA